jgi:hypothetical protein
MPPAARAGRWLGAGGRNRRLERNTQAALASNHFSAINAVSEYRYDNTNVHADQVNLPSPAAVVTGASTNRPWLLSQVQALWPTSNST